jgi:hypothetical protein
MPEPSSSHAPRRRVGVYARLHGPAGDSLARLQWDPHTQQARTVWRR